MICPNCGKVVDDSFNVCPDCGTVLNVEGAAAAYGTTEAPENTTFELEEETGKKDKYKDKPKKMSKEERKLAFGRDLEAALESGNKLGIMSVKSIVLSWIVMSIPVIGIFFAIAWACGLSRKQQKTYLARAFLILSLLFLFLLGAGWFVYAVILKLTLNDLPTVIRNIYLWFYGIVHGIFS